MNFIRNLLLIPLMLSLPMMAFSQGWERAYDDRWFSDLVQTADGSYTISEADFSSHPLRSRLVKIDLDGDVIWSKYISPDSSFNAVYTLIESNARDGYILGGDWRHPDSQSIRRGQAQLYRTDEWGNLLWTRRYGRPDRHEEIYDVINCADGGYAFLMSQNLDSATITAGDVLVRVDEQGELLWQTVIQQDSSSVRIEGGHLVQLADFSFAMHTVKTSNLRTVSKVSKDGEILWAVQPQIQSSTSKYSGTRLVSLDNGEFRLIGSINRVQPPNYREMYDDIFILHLDANGQTINEQIIDYQNDAQYVHRADILPNGNVVISGEHVSFNQSIVTEALPFMAVVNPAGDVLFYKNYLVSPPIDIVFPFVREVISDANGGFALIIHGYSSNDPSYLIRTDSLGHSFTNMITGTVFEDADDDCILTTGEQGLEDWIVQLSGEIDLFTLTDSTGRYQFLTDTGQYTVKVIPIGNYWSFNCIDSINHHFTTFFDTLETDYPVYPSVLCPNLTVDISTPFLRRCFETTYYVNYCNHGTVTADSASIEILLDSFLILQTVSRPFTQIGPNLYSFELGDLEIGDCGQFNFNVITSCDAMLGQTHCVEASIYPDTICATSSSWSGASIAAEGRCLGDSVRFVLRNVGTTATSMPLDYMVIIDDVILRHNTFSLPSGDSMVIYQETSGQMVRLQAEQESHHPLNNHPSVSIEGCGANGGPISLGFITQFPQDDSYPTVDIDCQENIGAYDPNDKRGFPTGYDTQRYIEPNTDLEYLIRFQNTGTDTAFRVVILDTLQEGLEVSSVRPSVASHDYQFDILGSNILQFTFDNILLPDSNINEAASHGFVKFTIDQTKDNPLGLRINNEAAIFFDFNAPIITNTTLHTVQEEFITVSIDPQPLAAGPQVLVRPNPMGNSAVLELEGKGYDQLEFRLYDSSGRLIRQSRFSGNQYQIQRENLTEGFYLFQLLSQQQMISSGKLIIH
ncbi:MAG: T9SS type A sorting domain-containing protein [Bacteroidota bacterium]